MTWLSSSYSPRSVSGTALWLTLAVLAVAAVLFRSGPVRAAVAFAASRFVAVSAYVARALAVAPTWSRAPCHGAGAVDLAWLVRRGGAVEQWSITFSLPSQARRPSCHAVLHWGWRRVGRALLRGVVALGRALDRLRCAPDGPSTVVSTGGAAAPGFGHGRRHAGVALLGLAALRQSHEQAGHSRSAWPWPRRGLTPPGR